MKLFTVIFAASPVEVFSWFVMAVAALWLAIAVDLSIKALGVPDLHNLAKLMFGLISGATLWSIEPIRRDRRNLLSSSVVLLLMYVGLSVLLMYILHIPIPDYL